MIHAPNLVGDEWINVKRPLGLEDIKEKVVLYDFWTYSCLNCINTLPYIKKWWEKYKGKNFLIIGIHTPEFEFEKDYEKVRKAVLELGISWPVVLDNQYLNWSNFANHFWPAKYLTDVNRRIVYEHFGEGRYVETENAIRKLLGLEQIKKKEERKQGKVCLLSTPEIYLGYQRGNLSFPEKFIIDKETDYVKPRDVEPDSVALDGKFISRKEFLFSKSKGSIILLHFSASKANLVCGSKNKAKLRVIVNNQKVDSLIRGRDLNQNDEVLVDSYKMYELIDSNFPLSGVMEIILEEGEFESYAFTFSSCMDLKT